MWPGLKNKLVLMHFEINPAQCGRAMKHSLGKFVESSSLLKIKTKNTKSGDSNRHSISLK